MELARNTVKIGVVGSRDFPSQNFRPTTIKKNFQLEYIGMVWCVMGAFLQLTAAHFGGQFADLTQEEVQHLWRYNLYSQGKYFNEFSSRACWLSVL